MKNLREVNVDTNTVCNPYDLAHTSDRLVPINLLEYPCQAVPHWHSTSLSIRHPGVGCDNLWSFGCLSRKCWSQSLQIGWWLREVEKGKHFHQRKVYSFSKAYSISFRLAESNFTFHDIFEEIPIEIQAGGLASGFLASLGNQSQLQDQYEHFELSTSEFMQKNLEVSNVFIFSNHLGTFLLLLGPSKGAN